MYLRDFDFSNSNDNNILSVLIGADSFFYAILDPNGKIICHKSYENIHYSYVTDIQSIKSDLNLKKSFQKIIVTSNAGESYFLPEINHELIYKIPSLELKNKKFEKIISNETYHYFGISTYQENLLNELFGPNNYHLTHFSNVLASYYIQNIGQIIHAHIESKRVILFVQNDGKFQFYNEFATENNADILYFILAIYQLHGLDPKTEKLSISGWIDFDSALNKLIEGYISKVDIIIDPKCQLDEQSGDKMKPHFYFIHFASALCVL